jgi:hypothetical protein
MFETKDYFNQKIVKLIEYEERYAYGINNLIAVKNGIFISFCGDEGI